MRRTTPEDMRPTMTAWFPGARPDAIDYVCAIAAEMSDDPDMPQGKRRNLLLARLEEAENEELDRAGDAWPRPPRGPAQELMIRYRLNKHVHEH